VETKKIMRTIEVTVDTDEFLVIRERQRFPLGWCAACACEARMIKPEAAAALRGTSVREVYRRIETGEVHFAERSDGLVLVCLNSLV
jgi:hypothetical protein